VASILECVVQPVWAVDQAGLIRFANPSALAALGYGDVSELLGRPSHQTIHYKRPDGSTFPAEECLMLRPRRSGQPVHGTNDWFVRKDGSMFPVEYWSAPIGMPGGRGTVVAFTDISERRRTEAALRERDAILSALGQPVWVITPEAVISYANPAAVTALGFGDPSELIGKNAHWLVHYKRPDGSRFPIEDCPLARVRQTGEPVYVEHDWVVRKDGSIMPVTSTAVPIRTPEGYGVAVAFTDMTSRLAAEQAARERDVAEARAAELTASAARERAVLEAALDGVISVDVRARITYVNSAAERIFGYRAEDLLGRELAEAVVPPSLRDAHRRGLARYLATGEARVLDRRIEISAMRADGSEFPAELTVTLTGSPEAPSFTGYVRDITERQNAERELVAARERFKVVADEQTALRRVATLVATAAPPEEVFAAVTAEGGRVLTADVAILNRYAPDGTEAVVGVWASSGVPPLAVGTRMPLGGRNVSSLVFQTGLPASIDDYGDATGMIGDVAREIGIRALVGVPVSVAGEVWGVMIVANRSEPLPADTEARLARFTELAATAIGKAQAQAELAASRARMVTSFDAARQRVTRDLHDGAQQLFVSSIINLQRAQQEWSSSPMQARRLLDDGLRDAQNGINELREIAAGIHPAILTQRGLAAALEALAARVAVPVELDVTAARLPEPVESSIYFFCSEALTNVVKHADAKSARVRVVVQDDRCTVEVRDDGLGGAEPRSRSGGLTGLQDRLGALGGAVDISSPAGGGTTLRAWVPLRSGPARLTEETRLTEEKSPEVCCGQVLLGHERDRSACVQQLRWHMIDIRRCQHDPGPRASNRQRPGHGKAVRSRKADVQEDPARALPGHGSQRLFTIRGLFQPVETARGQQFSRHSAKARAVIHDQDREGHVTHPDGAPPTRQSGEPHNRRPPGQAGT
jgi:PAS domain S-box-containing protein